MGWGGEGWVYYGEETGFGWAFGAVTRGLSYKEDETKGDEHKNGKAILSDVADRIWGAF